MSNYRIIHRSLRPQLVGDPQSVNINPYHDEELWRGDMSPLAYTFQVAVQRAAEMHLSADGWLVSQRRRLIKFGKLPVGFCWGKIDPPPNVGADLMFLNEPELQRGAD